MKLQAGTKIEFFYAQPGHEETYQIEVEEIRDTQAQPISRRALAKRPNTKRSRFLVTGRLLDTGKYKQFYHGSIQSAKAI
jgi:hypothetical protein